MKFRWPRIVFDEKVDEQMNRLQHEQDLAALKAQHRDELESIYAELVREPLHEEKPA